MDRQGFIDFNTRLSPENSGKADSYAREIHTHAELMAELEATGYRRSQKRLTPKQVSIIEKYLG